MGDNDENQPGLADENVTLRKLIEQNTKMMQLMMQQLMNQANVGPQTTAGVTNQNQNTTPVRTTTLFSELEKRIKPFEFDPETESVFPVWYERYKLVFTEDAKSLDDKSRVRLLLEKLEDSCYKQFASHVLPQEPTAIAFDDAVTILKEIFDIPVSKFTQRYKCWTSEFDKSPLEDDQQYGDRINERFHKVMEKMSVEDYKVLRFLVGLKGRDDAEHLPYLLSFADKKSEEPTGVKLQDLIRELKKLRTYKADGQLISKPGFGVKVVREKNESYAVHDVVCWNCGQKGHRSVECPHRKVTCKKCGRYGHPDQYWEPIVNTKPGGRPIGKEQQGKRKLKRCKVVKAQEALDERIVKSVRRYTDVEVNGTLLTFQTDTGSDVTIIDRKSWKQIGEPKLQKPTQTLKVANDSEFTCLGMFECEFTLCGDHGAGKAYVVDGVNLLGLEWMSQSPTIQRSLDSIGYAMRVEKVPRDIASSLAERFPKVFEESLGRCVVEKAKLDLKIDAKPKFFKPRPVPYAALESVEKELDRLIAMEVIEPINHSKWAAPIVAVKKKSGVIRVCSDFSTGLNAALEDNEHPLPVPEDIFASLNGGKVFSQIDLSDAYLQVEVEEESRKLLAVNTHRGLFQYRRLPFGVKTAPAIFQSIMDKMCAGLKGVVCYLDDVLIKGDNEEDHYRNLVALFERIAEYGFKLRLKKCSFSQREIKFLGYVVDAKGRRPDPEKISAITEMKPPENVFQLRSFLGMVSYYGNFIPKIKSKRGKLDELTHKDVSWKWDESHQRSFEQIREALSSDLNLAHYDPSLPIVVAADACEYGVGGVLSHRFPDGSEKPVQHFSQALAAAEKNYGQIEKEALALVTAVKKFHKFIYGRKFLLQTDHKPLVTIYGSKKGLPQHSVNRLIRWGTILLGYNFDIEYVNTTDFAKADALSRLLKRSETPHEDTVIAQVEVDTNATLECCARSLPVTEHQICDETNKDRVLKEVRNRVQNNSWPKNSKKLLPELVPFFNRKGELTVVQGCVVSGDRVVVPPALRVQVLRELHRGHPGMVRMKQLARSYVYWPNIDNNIEFLVKNCEKCQLAAKTPRKVPLCPWPKAEKPWQRIHIDFVGPENGMFYFVVVDAMSKWPEIIPMKTISARNTIAEMIKMFARYGLPETIVSDNGTQFTSAEFAKMCVENGIEHIRTAPYHPQSNGQAERFVDMLKRGLRKLKGEGGASNDQLNELLFTYRTTPSFTLNNQTPAELFMCRKLRTRSTQLLPVSDVSGKIRNSDYDVIKDQFDRKHGVKDRCFAIGDLVWAKVYHNNHWHWEHGKIVEKCGRVNYQVAIHHKTRMFHANQLRKASDTSKWLNTMLHTFNLPERKPGIPKVAPGAAEPLPNDPQEANQQVVPGPVAPAAQPAPVVVPVLPAPVVAQQPRRSTRPRKPVQRLTY